MEIAEQIYLRANSVAGAVFSTDWMRELPIAAFGGKRAAELIDKGEAVLAWLDSLDAGSFA
jgi:Protein of unknown function (DUF2384)